MMHTVGIATLQTRWYSDGTLSNGKNITNAINPAPEYKAPPNIKPPWGPWNFEGGYIAKKADFP